MKTLSRREFLYGAALGVGGAYLAGSRLRAAAAAGPTEGTARAASDRVMLGKTGIKGSLLAHGTGYNGSARSSDHTRMGKPAFEKLLRHSLDNGVSFIDTADLYGTHPYIKDVIRQFKRDDLVILSKVWPRQDYWNVPSPDGKQEVQRFCRELGTDRLDIVLIHCATDDKWTQSFEGLRNGLADLKQAGTVRAVGVSCHNFGALKVAANDPWVDVIFARINHKGGNAYAMDGTVEAVGEVLKAARANGKAVVGMKIFGAGKLTGPEDKDASLKYVLGNRLVDAMTIGMRTTEEVDDTIKRIGQALKG
jgi:aryl-alcohol dehydrogenase-like predicted oxidoreductase